MTKEERSVYNKEYGKKNKYNSRYISKMIYGNQRLSSVQRGHEMPSYDLSQLREWLENQRNWRSLLIMYKIKKTKDSKPSVDRKDDNMPYTFDNIQLMTWKENDDKEHEKQKKITLQYDLDMNLIAEFSSLSEAGRLTNINIGHISVVCSPLGRRKTAGGFIWKYK